MTPKIHDDDSVANGDAALTEYEEELAEQGMLFQRARHARYFEPAMPYHVLWQVLGAFFLLRPDRQRELQKLVAGVIAKAQFNWPEVSLYAASFLSTHALCAAAHND